MFVEQYAHIHVDFLRKTRKNEVKFQVKAW